MLYLQCLGMSLLVVMGNAGTSKSRLSVVMMLYTSQEAHHR